MNLHPARGLTVTLDRGGLHLGTPPPGVDTAEAGPWRAWVAGRVERLDRLAGAHRGPAHPAALLLQIAAAAGPKRALAQLEGHALVMISDGKRLWLAADRLGLFRWWWQHDGAALRCAAHPGALAVAGRAAPQMVPAGGLLEAESGPPQISVWWDPGAPPAGRAGTRAVWDRAAEHALALGALRAAEAAGAAAPEGADPDPAALDALLDQMQILDLPRPPGSAAALCAMARPALGPQLLPMDALLGEGLPRIGAGRAWTAARHALADDTLLPLAMAAWARGTPLFAPSPVHPFVLQALATIPALHLVGMRGSLLRRRGLARWTAPAGLRAWLAAPHALDTHPQARADLGPPPAGLERAVWRARAAWAWPAR